MDSIINLSFNDGIAKIELGGRLDATNAPALQEKLKEIIGQDVKDLVFMAKDLEYISSAGLRVIIFAKQKLGGATKVYLVEAQDTVKEVIEMSGLTNFMIITDSY